MRVRVRAPSFDDELGDDRGVRLQCVLEMLEVHGCLLRGVGLYAGRVEWQAVPIEWDVVYPTQSEPIGRIRAVRSGFRAQLGSEFLGEFPTGDAAAKAVWERFLEQNAARHAHAAVTHGGRERHR